MKHYYRWLVCLFLVGSALFTCFAAQAQEEVHNPLITPQKIRYIETEQRYFNMLFVGIDYGHTGYWGSFGKRELDYIHGDDTLVRLAGQAGSVGFLLPPLDKDSLFEGVSAAGVLPRKTFSMGHAREKRYYLESRRLK